MRRLLCIAAVLCLSAVSCSSPEPESLPKQVKMDYGLIVLGIDGMDYELTRRYMREGKLPNLKKLADQGKFQALATTKPPQSPVAWSTFMTGMSPEGHGIYDFVHRDPHDHITPYLSTSKAEQPDCTIEIGDLQIPYCSAEVKSLRKGMVFWEQLEDEGIPATIYKVPANFPPHEDWHNETLSGMGTPDLMGTYGTFQVFTDDPELAKKKISGGIPHPVEWVDKTHARAILHGPPDAYTKGNPPMELVVDMTIDKERKVVLIDTGDQQVLLPEGTLSHWVPIAFEAPMFLGSVPGMVRMYVKSLDPFVLYVSPINLDPIDPVMPISSTRGFSAEVAKEAGRYYTQGMPEDTKALGSGVLSDAEFLVLADAIFEERTRLLDRALDSYDGGLMFFYFSSLDQLCHVFWRSLDAKEGDELYAFKDVIPDIYMEMDKVVGEVLERAPEGTEVLILSDHGFAPFSHKVNLNTWLYQKGYLALREDGSRGEGPLGHIDWSKTQAYALGLNQLFINQKGREPEGSVSAQERPALLRRLKRDMESMRDPKTGRAVIRRVFDVDPTFNPDRAPDLIVGYERGYRSSDGGAMGEVSGELIVPNNDKWSGDHCMDPAVVPGIVFTTAEFDKEHSPHLRDMAPTIVNYFGLETPEGLEGKSILATPAARK